MTKVFDSTALEVETVLIDEVILDTETRVQLYHLRYPAIKKKYFTGYVRKNLIKIIVGDTEVNIIGDSMSDIYVTLKEAGVKEEDIIRIVEAIATKFVWRL